MGLKANHVIRHCTCREATLDGEPEIVKEEVRRGARRLKRKKEAGMCGIVSEMLVVMWLYSG